jgi:hypothetical protein
VPVISTYADSDRHLFFLDSLTCLLNSDGIPFFFFEWSVKCFLLFSDSIIQNVSPLAIQSQPAGGHRTGILSVGSCPSLNAWPAIKPAPVAAVPFSQLLPTTSVSSKVGLDSLTAASAINLVYF